MIVGDRPVCCVPEKDGGFDVLGYDWATTGLIRDNHAWESLFDGGIDAIPVGEAEFRACLDKAREAPPGKDVDTFVFRRLKINVDERDEEGLLTQAAGVEKAKIEYNGDLSRLTNIVCSSMICASQGKIQEALALMAREQEVVRSEDRFKRPLADGYGCIMANLRMPNGHICEIDFHLQALVDVKDRIEDLYDEQFEIGRQRLIEDRPFSPYEARRIIELLEEESAAYEKALKAG